MEVSMGLPSLVGQYVICRCYGAGVHAGTVVAQDGQVVHLSGARRLWSWKAKQGVALSGVAVHGIDRSGSKLDTETPVHVLTDVIELIPCSPGAQVSIADA